MGILDEIFDKISSSRIFKSRETLRPDYIPQNLPHRDNEIRKLGSILAPILNGERPSNVFLYGLPGTGKTAVTKYVLSKLYDKTLKSNVNFTYAYINCRRTDTPYRVLADIAYNIGVKVPFTGLSTAEVYRRIVRGLSGTSKILLIVLDEIDHLVRKHGDDILYKLVRINEELTSAKISLIGITNDIRLTEILDPRVKSSLGEEEIIFPPYDALQLEDILSERAKIAFNEGVLEEGVIPLCAALAAKEHGDARRALDLLRIAGEIAERLGDERVREAHVKMAREEIEKNRVIEVLRTMPLHGKLVTLSVVATSRKETVPTTGAIYRTYAQLCETLNVEVLTPRRISDIINELDMLGIITARLISRGRYGRTKVIKLNISHEMLKEAFSNEERISNILRKLL